MQGGNLSPHRSEFICFISKCLQRIAQNIYSIYQYTEEKIYLIKLFIQYGYEYLSTKSQS